MKKYLIVVGVLVALFVAGSAFAQMSSAQGKASAKDIQRCQNEADKQHIRPADRDAFVDQCLGAPGTMGGTVKERETYDSINEGSERMGGTAGPHLKRKSQ
jgi:hypothetical protein